MKKKLLIIILILTVVGSGLYFYKERESVATVELSSQNSNVSVLVDQANLVQDGYLVVRGIEGNRLGQIIEISPLLDKGEHTNIKINLGDFYNGGEELIVMMYVDNGDKSFSGLTQPFKDKNGAMIAIYVSTGKPVPKSITEPTVSFDAIMGMNMARVHYTNSGFEPKTLTIPKGTMVEFLNNSDIEMWVASDPHPQHDILATFDGFESIKKGKIYTYVFDKVGTWPYHDHINAAKGGLVIVF